MNRIIITLAALATTVTSASVAGTSEATPTSARPNILFISVDDLRPALHCYGDPIAITPNLDALASSGTLFKRAYCQQAVCAPSRASLMTGKRPDSTGVHDLRTHFRKALPDVVTLSQHFIKNGYIARSIGKIYHGGLDDPASWSVPPYEATTTRTINRDIAETVAAPVAEAARNAPREGAPLLKNGKKQAGSVSAPRKERGPAWRALDAADEELRDGQTASGAIEMLHEVKDQPFFLAVGFVKPHLPFEAPKKYFDLYPPDKINLSKYPTPTSNAPRLAFAGFGELRSYQDIGTSATISDDKARELIRGYYAATSYMDSQVGRVLDELDRLNLREKTIVIVWGDHGWHLGDLGQWCKHTNFDVATRAALILRSPGQKAQGRKTEALVELVDVYPTLCELAGLELPAGLEGISFAPLLNNPDEPWKTGAFSQYPRKDIMGYSIKTDKHRYTEWMATTGTREKVAAELYLHDADPGETRNVSGDSEHAELQKQLREQLLAGWKAAGPPAKRP